MLFRFLLIVIPLVIGGSIYIGWRPKTLIMFSWFEFIGILDIIISFREWLSSYQITDWLLYWGPNGLWTFAFTSALAFIWLHEHSNHKYLWLGLPFIFGLTMEVGQYFNLLHGTFCFGDIVAHILGSTISLII